MNSLDLVIAYAIKTMLALLSYQTSKAINIMINSDITGSVEMWWCQFCK